MNETAVEKCGVGADECLSNKEKKINRHVKTKTSSEEKMLK